MLLKTREGDAPKCFGTEVLSKEDWVFHPELGNMLWIYD